MSQDRFSNPKYIDWLKVKLSLQYAKEGLEPITDHNVQRFYNYLCSRLQTPSSSSATGTCNSCVKTVLQRQWSRQNFTCAGGICDDWLKLLQESHVNPTTKVEWDNFDVSQLPVSPWECAKLYLPHGNGKVKGAGDADMAAILTLYMNCRYFAADLQDVSMCEKVKEIRNKLLHSGSMEVDRGDMLDAVSIIKQLLSDNAFAANKTCKEAVDRIDKLVKGKLEVSQTKEHELSVLNTDIKSVADSSKELRRDLDDLTVQVQQQQDTLRTEVSDVTRDVSSLKEQLNTSEENIEKLQTFAGRLEQFVNAYQIDKVDMAQLTASIGTLSTLTTQADRQGQILAQLQDIVDRHEVELERHGGMLQQHEGALEMQGVVLQHYGERLQQLEGTSQHHGGVPEQRKRKLDDSIASESKAKMSRSDRQSTDMTDLESLQKHLIAVYKEDCKWENPLTVDEDRQVTISQMYVSPELKLVRQRDPKAGLVKVQHKQIDCESGQPSYQQIFYTNTEKCQNIYITGNAGMGKTTLCKQLVNTWCKVVQNIAIEGDSAEDVRVLKDFSLLFYVNLRDVGSQYHIEDMIGKNILHTATKKYTVSDLLRTEKCLVVLDGLDEWSCPQGVDTSTCRGLNKEIPGRNTMHTTCTYLTTTRNWKFDFIDLKSKDCDKHLELFGIGEHSSCELAEKIVSQLGIELERPISDFFDEVKEKKLTTLTSVPVLLIQLVTLWYYFKDLGKSQVQLYCKMLELLLDQAQKHLSEQESTVTKPLHPDAKLPNCFSSEEGSCHSHAQLLLCLSKLAFMSLLSKKKEDTLVFKSPILKICGIVKKDISLCLKCGIFTQTKVLDNPTGRFMKYSFLHKKVQEFLAAVYLVTSKDVEDNMGQIREYCNRLDTTLEMGQVFMFVCGMNSEIGNQLLDHHASVVSNDKSVQNYRKSIVGESLITDIHTAVMACITEGASNDLAVDVYLQDYRIDKDTISEFVSHIVGKKNIISTKSVFIYTTDCIKEDVTVVLEHLKTVQTLEKFWLRDHGHVVNDRGLLTAVITNNTRTLKSLCLGRDELLDQDVFPAVLGCIPTLQSLWLGEAWVLSNTYEGHDRIKQLLATQTSHLTQLCLELYCPEHQGKCRFLLDLSDHTRIQTLDLNYMCVTNLHAVAHSVENVDLWHVTVAHSTLRRFIEALALTSNKVEVELFEVTVTEDNGDNVGLAAYLKECGKFNVEECDIGSDNTWNCVRFHKK